MATSEQQKTAILFFSRTPQEEVNAKKFTFRRSRAAVRLLLQHSLRQARKTTLPLYTCYSAQQKGNCFGERLANALENVFAQGHENVIIIGNDSPGLTTNLLLRANEKLNANQLVLGPATDGGVYLIGINTRLYEREKFLALAWETAALQFSWQEYAPQTSTVLVKLPQLADIDDAQEFWRFLRHRASSFLGKKLSACLSFFGAKSRANEVVLLQSLNLAAVPPPHRGPPPS